MGYRPWGHKEPDMSGETDTSTFSPSAALFMEVHFGQDVIP